MENKRTRRKGFTRLELLIVGAMITTVAAFGCGIYFGGKAIGKYLSYPDVTPVRSNVIGNEREEKFIEFGGEKFYAEVDGRPVREYLEDQN